MITWCLKQPIPLIVPDTIAAGFCGYAMGQPRVFGVL